MYHVHYVDDIYRNYIGWYDYGTDWTCKVSGSAGCTFSASRSSSWSNTWGASIGFSRSVIDAAINGSVGASGSWTVTINIGPYYNGTYQLRYQPTYRFHDMHVHTQYCDEFGCSNEYGTAHARIYQNGEPGFGGYGSHVGTVWYAKKIG